MRAYVLQATTLKNARFPRVVKTEGISLFAAALKKNYGYFFGKDKKKFQGIFPNDPPSKS